MLPHVEELPGFYWVSKPLSHKGAIAVYRRTHVEGKGFYAWGDTNAYDTRPITLEQCRNTLTPAVWADTKGDGVAGRLADGGQIVAVFAFGDFNAIPQIDWDELVYDAAKLGGKLTRKAATK